MAIIVKTSRDTLKDHPSATSYHVDDDGRLHIAESGKGNIATYHSSAWLSVERVEPGK